MSCTSYNLLRACCITYNSSRGYRPEAAHHRASRRRSAGVRRGTGSSSRPRGCAPSGRRGTERRADRRRGGSVPEPGHVLLRIQGLAARARRVPRPAAGRRGIESVGFAPRTPRHSARTSRTRCLPCPHCRPSPGPSRPGSRGPAWPRWSKSTWTCCSASPRAICAASRANAAGAWTAPRRRRRAPSGARRSAPSCWRAGATGAAAELDLAGTLTIRDA